MKYSMGSGIIRYIRALKTFLKFHVLQSSACFEVWCVLKFCVLWSSVHFEVLCTLKFCVLQSSVHFKVLCISKFCAFQRSMHFKVPCTSKFCVVTILCINVSKKTHPVSAEKLTLDCANIMFLWNYTSFIIVWIKIHTCNLIRAILYWIRIWLPKISKFQVSIAWQRFLYYSIVSFVQK